MNAQEIEHEIERTVDKTAAANSDMRHVAAVMMRGVWEIALQLAQMNENRGRK